MNIIKNEQVDFFDVDETLVMHVDPATIPVGHKVRVFDAVTKKYIDVQINRPMIRLLMESAHRGSHVVVWSRGGYEWASNVIKALDLVDYVDMIMSKPLAYFDDKPISEWLPYRVYIPPQTIYKQTVT